MAAPYRHTDMRTLTALLILLIVALPGVALAHAQLRASELAEGAVVASAPTEIVLRFNEPISPLLLRLIGPDGTATDVEGSAENEDLTVRLPAELAEGTHLLSWRIVSADGHPVGGTLTFHIGSASAAPPVSMEPASGAARAVASLRFVLTTALIMAVGSAVFAGLVARSPMGSGAVRLAQLSAILSLPAGAALLGAQGLDLAALPPAALLTSAPWKVVATAPLTLTVVLSAGAAACAFVALRARSGRAAGAAGLAAWGLAGLSFAVSGHVSVAPPRWLTAPAMALHAMALIFWLGALLPLLSAMHGPDREVEIRRFSALAVPLIALLVASGAALTWAQAGGDLPALAGSTYGTLLGAKLVLVLGLLGLAARNRLVLTPALTAGSPDAAPCLARAIRVEILVALVILALASGFRLTPPPRALTPPAEPVHLHVHTDRAMVDMTLTPGRAGPVSIELGFQTGRFDALVPLEVELTFAMPAAGIEPIRIEARPGGDGLWRAGPLTLPTPGEWEVSLQILITDFESLTLRDTITLEP